MSMTRLIEYDCDDIVDPELICPICHLPFTDPHVAKCGHTFCIGCITFWDEDYCPSPSCEDNWTKVDIKPITAKFVHNMLNRIQVNCKACGQKWLRRDQFELHREQDCPKELIYCKALAYECPWMGFREERLKSSGINDQTVKLLMNVLKNDNNTLETLNLSMNNDLTDACLNYVVEMLEYNQSIRRISFLYCNISMEAQNDFETKISKRKDVSIYFVPKWQRHDAKLSIGEQFVFL
ncbi:unnamed protein product [Rotaria sp. Silwood2]|nr:unnamed protein product [Rotaria sp. Silwood2]CAF3995983.1 unnamed protein product [Rotaria sp. Silwood2]